LCINLNASGARIIIGKNNAIASWGMLNILSYQPQGGQGSPVIEIGDNNYFNGNIVIIPPISKSAKIKIGNGNLFAGGVRINGISSHLIFDLQTKDVLNKEMGVKIGDNNWICEDSLFLNKADIKNNSVVAARSIVNKNFSESNVLIANDKGSAGIKKRNIGWHEYMDNSYIYTDNPRQQVKDKEITNA